jgi:hypothetical protein
MAKRALEESQPTIEETDDEDDEVTKDMMRRLESASNELLQRAPKRAREEVMTPNDDGWNFYRISQKYNNDYDTFSEALVVAKSEDDARKMHPLGVNNRESSEVERMEKWAMKREGLMPDWYSPDHEDWVRPAFVQVQLISSFDGEAELHNSVIISSFHAG